MRRLFAVLIMALMVTTASAQTTSPPSAKDAKLVCSVDGVAQYRVDKKFVAMIVLTPASFDSLYGYTPNGKHIMEEWQTETAAQSQRLGCPAKLLLLIVKNFNASDSKFCVDAHRQFTLERAGQKFLARGVDEEYCIPPDDAHYFYIIFTEVDFQPGDEFYFYVALDK